MFFSWGFYGIFKATSFFLCWGHDRGSPRYEADELYMWQIKPKLGPCLNNSCPTKYINVHNRKDRELIACQILLIQNPNDGRSSSLWHRNCRRFVQLTFPSLTFTSKGCNVRDRSSYMTSFILHVYCIHLEGCSWWMDSVNGNGIQEVTSRCF